MIRSIIFFFLAGSWAMAQIPRQFTLQLYLETNQIPLQGSHDVAVFWYGQPVGGTAEHSENFVTQASEGIVTLTLGSTVPLPLTLLQRGLVWLGISIDGAPELLPRTALNSVPYSLFTHHADIADALSPDVTGVVTSVNEVAGRVELVAGRGVTISRDGHTLTLEASRSFARGQLKGIAGVFEYTVSPGIEIPPEATIAASVLSNTYIGVSVRNIDYQTNTITLCTAAPLTDTELIQWVIY
ncbi:MAG: hypothetical protein IAE64_02415 [Flavobacteriales bacterium]|nr:MAG: hypothetical protein F9K28_03885 [Bacteroidota bacterium]MBE2265086.1 hypothetical protein [Flavobacteriales bacterium]MBW7853110.1 hypothetical protein [Candidatus Kapabacteria bacterium]MCC6331401.1 hypothetical protein [Ignavibacteria bacterium]MBZ0194498.1 hypothetical protein [Candidatus Kapabacteria bacterium]